MGGVCKYRSKTDTVRYRRAELVEEGEEEGEGEKEEEEREELQVGEHIYEEVDKACGRDVIHTLQDLEFIIERST